MPKPNPLTQGLNKAAVAGAAPAQERNGNPSRAGRVLIGGHFSPETQRLIKMMAADETTTVQDLLAEAINMLLAKRGKPEIARVFD